MQTKIYNFLHRWQGRVRELRPIHIAHAVTLLVMIVGATGFILYGQGSLDWRRQAAGQPARLRFNPSRLVISPQTPLVIDVTLDTGSYTVTGAELHVNSLNTSNIVISNIEAVHPNLSVEVNKTVNPQTVVVSFVSNCTDTCTHISGREIIARVTITSVSPGQTQLTFGGSQISALGESVNVLGDANPLSIKVR